MPDALSTDLREQMYSHERFKGRISLNPITRCMKQLDNPQDAVPVIHVAGTNGKGSTATILACILEAAGYTTGLYTSPHLTSLRERIQVNGQQISWKQVGDRYDEITATGVDLSFFECTTGIAFTHFADQGVDVAVMETGMGGRLDATNIVAPEAAVITNVARDHTRFLGETAEQIAYEKAGIIKPGRPVVSGAAGTPQQVIARVAEKQDAPLTAVRDAASLRNVSGRTLTLDLHGTRVETGLVGGYQLDNINTALTVLEVIDAADFEIPDTAVQQGLEQVRVPGRMEVVSEAPLTLLDGAHNPAGMRRACETLERVAQGEVVAVVSIMADKQYGSMLDEVGGVADTMICTRAELDRAADPEDLAAACEHAEVVPDITDAIEAAHVRAGARDTIIYTGSLYVVGNVKQRLQARS